MTLTLALHDSRQDTHFENLIVERVDRNSINKGYSVKKTNQKRSLSRKYFSKAITGLLLLTVLSACSTGLTVRSEIDPTADFSQYTSYNFFEPMGIEGGYNSPIFGEHFRGAIGGEMSRRGYRTADRPKLLINVTIRSDDKVRMRSYTSPYVSGGYYNRPGGAYGGSAIGVGVSTGRRATMTTEASVFIDFVDLQEQRVVWQGVAVVDVNDKVATQLRDAIYTAVNTVMAQYPHTAGK